MYSMIEKMHISMKSFTEDIEHKLDKCYKGGASNKFGVDGIITDDKSEQNDNDDIKEILRKCDSSAFDDKISMMTHGSKASIGTKSISTLAKKTKDGTRALKPKMPKAKE